MRVLRSYDPGKHTGVVEIDIDTFEVLLYETVPNGVEGFVETWFEDSDAIAYESFILRRGVYTSDQIDPVYVIGAILQRASDAGIPTASYPPSTTKQITDEALQNLGWFITPKTPNRHINDAFRVAACYMRDTGNIEFMKKGWPE